MIQNAAARLDTGTRKSERMTPVLRDLHWLPVRQHITFKIAVLVDKCQHSMTPQYLQMYCEHASTLTTRHLQSARLIVPRTRTNYGDRSFAIQGPLVWNWNSLPAELRTQAFRWTCLETN